MTLYKEIDDFRKRDERAALCIIVRSVGSTPRSVGTKMIVQEDGSIIGTIGGGNLEKKIIEDAIIQIQKNEPKLFKHDLLRQHDMCCGGSIDVYIEPIKKMNKLYIFGAGHTGSALATLAKGMDFEVYVIDDRKAYLDGFDDDQLKLLNLNHEKVMPKLSFDENTFIAIMTYEHSYDREILAYCIKQRHAYLGMIGSMRKVELTKKMFLSEEIATVNELESIDMPMGLKINAESPEEIAISILAKLVKIKNG